MPAPGHAAPAPAGAPGRPAGGQPAAEAPTPGKPPIPGAGALEIRGRAVRWIAGGIAPRPPRRTAEARLLGAHRVPNAWGTE